MAVKPIDDTVFADLDETVANIGVVRRTLTDLLDKRDSQICGLIDDGLKPAVVARRAGIGRQMVALVQRGRRSY